MMAKPGQRVALVGWLALSGGTHGVVFDSSTSRYPGISIRVMTSSTVPESGGAQVIPGDPQPLFPANTLESIQGRTLRRPDPMVSGNHQWWIPVIAVISIHRAGCWSDIGAPIRFHIGGTQFSAFAGGFGLRTPGQQCPIP